MAMVVTRDLKLCRDVITAITAFRVSPAVDQGINSVARIAFDHDEDGIWKKVAHIRNAQRIVRRFLDKTPFAEERCKIGHDIAALARTNSSDSVSAPPGVTRMMEGAPQVVAFGRKE